MTLAETARRKALAAGGGAVLFAGLLAGCIYLPSHIDAIPAGGGWMALPLRGWIAEGQIAPEGLRAEGIGACLAADCAPRVGVAVFRATGAEARAAARILKDPAPLLRHLEERDAADLDPKRKAVRTLARSSSVIEGRLHGFALTLTRADGSRTAHAMALGTQSGDTLRFAIVIGESEEGVRQAAREVAAKLR